jgi:hypothetical protein
MADTQITRKDCKRVSVAKGQGCPEAIAWMIIESCRRYSLPIALGMALFQKESGFRNVFGHDPTTSIPNDWMGGEVNRKRYDHYKSRRARFGMQGVGDGQLTWWETQDYADKKGGCWKREINIDVSVETLAARIRDFGYAKGIERYNGSGPRAVQYSISVRRAAEWWKARFDA